MPSFCCIALSRLLITVFPLPPDPLHVHISSNPSLIFETFLGHVNYITIPFVNTIILALPPYVLTGSETGLLLTNSRQAWGKKVLLTAGAALFWALPGPLFPLLISFIHNAQLYSVWACYQGNGREIFCPSSK